MAMTNSLLLCCIFHVHIQIRSTDRCMDGSCPYERQQRRSWRLSPWRPSLCCRWLWWAGVSQYCGSIWPADKWMDTGIHPNAHILTIQCQICWKIISTNAAFSEHTLHAAWSLTFTFINKPWHVFFFSTTVKLTKEQWQTQEAHGGY